MTKNRFALFLGVLLFLAQVPAFAEAPSPAGNHPCQKLKSACEAAGYFKGGWKQGKGLARNCMQPLLSNREVAGVSVQSSDVQACQAKKAKRN